MCAVDRLPPGRGWGSLTACLVLLALTGLACCAPPSPGVCRPDRKVVTHVYVSYDVISDAFRLRDVQDEQTVAHAELANCINTTGYVSVSVTSSSTPPGM